MEEMNIFLGTVLQQIEREQPVEEAVSSGFYYDYIPPFVDEDSNNVIGEEG